MRRTVFRVQPIDLRVRPIDLSDRGSLPFRIDTGKAV